MRACLKTAERRGQTPVLLEDSQKGDRPRRFETGFSKIDERSAAQRHTKFESDRIVTPAFIYDEGALGEALRVGRALADQASCRLLFPLKTCSTGHVLEIIAQEADGFACSSVFEAALARSLARDGMSVHMTSPGIRPSDVGELGELCDCISFNTLGQYHRFKDGLPAHVRAGLRVNPQ